jgi:hypothetical protein
MESLAPALLAACEAAYENPQIIAGPGGRDAATFDKSSSVLAFRGTLTEGLAAESDWINDFHADLVTDPRFPGKVHGGFLKSIDALWPFISDIIPRYITGHSKGGALALLAGWLFQVFEPTVITFAAPRVGNSAFARSYSMAFRYENPKDIVPKLPPWYASPGMQITAPASFIPPKGIRANHCLETGYSPWVI